MWDQRVTFTSSTFFDSFANVKIFLLMSDKRDDGYKSDWSTSPQIEYWYTQVPSPKLNEASSSNSVLEVW